MIENETILDLVKATLKIIYEQDNYLIKKEVSERSIVHHFANRFGRLKEETEYSHLDIDVEYNRNLDDKKKTKRFQGGTYPDFILHERGNNENNTLIIEFKTWWNLGTDDDLIKLQDFTDPNSVYKYDLGLSIIIGRDAPIGIIVQNGEIAGKFKMNEWVETKLGSITSKIGSGATPRGGANSYKESGISLIRSQNVLDFQFATSGLVFIDEEQAAALKNVEVFKNDVLVNITGDSVARCCIVPDNILPARVNQHVAIIRLEPNLADYRFIFYHLHYLKNELLSQAEIGATRRALTKGMLQELEILLPPLLEQRAIADVLSALDAKIDLLHRQNETLEALAQTLFRQWFVEDAQDEWEDGVLGDLVEFKYGKGLKKSIRTGEGFPVVGSSGIVDFHSDYLVEGPGIVTGRKGTLGKVIYLSENFFPIDTTFYIKSKNISPNLYYEYFLLKTIGFENMNTDSAVPGLNRNNALSMEVIVPSQSAITHFNNIVHPLFEKILSNKNQIQTLKKLRDTLLPKLMSGKVRV